MKNLMNTRRVFRMIPMRRSAGALVVRRRFVPKQSLRGPMISVYTAIRRRLRERKRYAKRQARLAGCGDFEMKEVDGVTVARGYGLNLGHVFDGDGVLIVEEIFRNGEYSFDVGASCVVIDIGMNIGLASLYFASRADVKAVYGFEPLKPTYEQAVFNFRINEQCGRKVHPCNYGLGDGDRQLTLEYYGRMSTVRPISDIRHSPKYPTIEETVVIKRAAEALRPILQRYKDETIVLKCDGEGAEKEIFQDLDSAGLLSSIDVIMLEYHFSCDVDLIERLKRNGFMFFRQRTASLETGDFGIIRAVRKQ